MSNEQDKQMVKQRVKCPKDGKKTVQQSEYPKSFFCPDCHTMWDLTERRGSYVSFQTQSSWNPTPAANLAAVDDLIWLGLLAGSGRGLLG